MTVLQLTDLDVQGVTLAERIEMLKQYPTYVGHDCEFVPVMHELFEQVGGWQVHHGACCPGRIDPHVTPTAMRLVAFYGPDLVRILAALEASDEDWPRRGHLIERLRALTASNQEG